MDSRFFGSISSGLYRGGASSILGMLTRERGAFHAGPLASWQVPREKAGCKQQEYLSYLSLTYKETNFRLAARFVGMADDERAYFAEGSADENIATSLKCAVPAAMSQHAARHTHAHTRTHARARTHAHAHHTPNARTGRATCCSSTSDA